MDAFEAMVGEILWREGFWVQDSVKVKLEKDEKVAIGRPTTPRWELDVVAYSGRRNELLVVECKSFFDSRGVTFKSFDPARKKGGDRYKLFNDDFLREVVFGRLKEQMLKEKMITKKTRLKMGLVCGKIATD